MESQGSSSEQCSLGMVLQDKCHSLAFCRKIGFERLDELSADERKLLKLRSGVLSELPTNGTLCFHHEKVFLSRFEQLQKHCCDPFKVHKNRITSMFITFMCRI